LPARWQLVAEALEAGKPILAVLENPWQLFLAVTVYADETSDPSGMRSMRPAELEEHLLRGFVPAVVDQSHGPDRPGWSADAAVAWLAHLALLTSQPSVGSATSATDIHLPDLWEVSARRYPRHVPAVVTAALSLLLVGADAVLALLSDGWAAVALWGTTVVAVAVGVLATSAAADLDAPLTRLDPSRLAGRSGRRRFRRDLQASALWGACCGMVAFLAGGLIFGWYFGAVGGVTLAVLAAVVAQADTVTSDLGPASSPSALAKQCVSFSLAWWALTIVVCTGPAMAMAVSGMGVAGVVFGLAFGLPAGTAAWLAVGNGAVWIRYALGVRSAARRNRLPHRPARFLDWCVSVGLMRMAGNTIQFRHKQLQDWLIRRAERSATASPTD
jgi:hypothetical protein